MAEVLCHCSAITAPLEDGLFAVRRIAAELFDFRAIRHVPDYELAILGHRGQLLALGAEVDVVDLLGVALEGVEFGDLGEVPEAYVSVGAAAGHYFPIGAYSNDSLYRLCSSEKQNIYY